MDERRQIERALAESMREGGRRELEMAPIGAAEVEV